MVIYLAISLPVEALRFSYDTYMSCLSRERVGAGATSVRLASEADLHCGVAREFEVSVVGRTLGPLPLVGQILLLAEFHSSLILPGCSCPPSLL